MKPAHLSRVAKIYFFVVAFSFSSNVLFSQQEYNHTFISLDPIDFNLQISLFENEMLIDVRTEEESRVERLHNAILASNSKQLFAISYTLDLEQPVFISYEEESRRVKACRILVK